jgi:hypothetical protein
MSWPAWLRIKGLNETSERVSALRCRVLEIHRGESAAIALAEELKADWFLTDDAGARLLAGAMGFEVHGSLGVVLWNAAQGQLDRTAAKQALQALDRSSLWISAAILREADQAIEDIFPQP